MSQHEFDGFKSAEGGFLTIEKTYYSNAAMASSYFPRVLKRMSKMPQLRLDHMCDVSKCLHDKDDCTADTELQATFALAKNMRGDVATHIGF